MYFYIYIMKFYNEYNNETEDIRGITYGESYADAVAKVIKDYGNDNIESLKMIICEDERTLELSKKEIKKLLKGQYS